MTSPSTNAAQSASRRSVSIRWPAPWIAGAVAILLLLVALVVGWLVQQSMRRTTRQSLETVLATNVTAIELWLAARIADVDRLAANEDLVRDSQLLLQQFAEGSEPRSIEAISRLGVNIPNSLLPNTYLGWSVIDLNGQVVASSHRQLVGKTLLLPNAAQKQLDRNTSVISKPIPSPVPLGDNGPLSRDGAAIMLALAPISEGRHTLGSLALMLDPMSQFSEIMAVSRIGETGETFAFDREGTLLSQSRFEPILRRTGVLDADDTSPLNVSLRESGSANQPLTVMADHATRGATGSNVKGYESYLGEVVVGAWRWLPQYNIGVATEMQYAEAYNTRRILRDTFIGALLLMLAAGLGRYLRPRLTHGTPDRRSSSKQLKRRLGQYELGKVIGRGGMGSVYHGRHHLLRRDVAIKVLEQTEATDRSLSRFEREVQMTAKLRHPNTVEIYDYGQTDEGTFFYVMEYVEGISLQQLLDHYGRQPPERVIYFLLQICGSIAEAHKQSMVHRDIKPANILLTARAGIYDLVKVLDFGLVKEIDRETMQLTKTESMTGTPLYMSPEVVRDASKANQRSDLYSIGAVGYTLLTGLPPFDGPSPADICAKQLNQDPIRPSIRIGTELSDDLQNILMSCLRKDPDERPTSAEDLADALMQCRDAGLWSVADACQWWESVFDGPRDDLGDFNDNPRPGPGINPPDKDRASGESNSDANVAELSDNANPTNKPSEKTAL